MKKTERRHPSTPARRPSEGPRPHIPEIHIDALTRALCKLLDFAEDLQFWIKDRAGRYCWMNRRYLGPWNGAIGAPWHLGCRPGGTSPKRHMSGGPLPESLIASTYLVSSQGFASARPLRQKSISPIEV